MYFPILTAKQNEIFALSELPAAVFETTIPVLIPPNSKSLKSQITRLVEKNIYFILVVNPQKATYPKQNQIQHEFIQGVLKGYKNYSLGFILDNKTSTYDLDDFFKSNPKLEKSLLHYGKFSDTLFLRKNSKAKYDIYLINKVNDDYINNTANGEIVYIEDGFKKQERNTDYPSHSEFSHLIFKYENEGIYGFGDFTIIGKEVSDTGGSPFAIALHLSKINSKDFEIRHFISNDNEDRKNQANKFTQALNKLINYIDANPIFEGVGIKDFRDRQADGHYPGLGVCKKMSIKNHIEQVSNHISIL
ncbi:hypothetical protein ATE47_12255 [Chryseobacterium sp. IHB B 17019]|uniref:sce7725 family protein n=1 Tax=Chryseobacterium sp. IHB B 17019 TaxID=1721091 RepID=UPI0007229598|nr:sce7725 family protein [Chryseobacterium sp. IHB B 17019]ALR31244.1 hypothetical protein ATE47_12255 [Chryseobacterium sp. IHB B 17019]